MAMAVIRAHARMLFAYASMMIGRRWQRVLCQ